jgi:putative sterol carrier protein
MADATAEFFDRLQERGREPALGRTTATIRVDLADGPKTEHWLVAIKRGDIAVSHENTPADCVISADRAKFDDIAAGRLNAMAAALRGVLGIEGDASLLVRFQRLFPAPTAPPIGAADRTVGKRRG